MPLVPHVSSGQIVASTWGNLVADHVVMRFTTAAQRASQLPAPVVNQLTSRDDAPGLIEYWTGSAWAVANVTGQASSYTPAWLPGSGQGGGGTITGRYRFIGPYTMALNVTLTLGTSPALPAGQVAIGLPAGYTAAFGDQWGSGALSYSGRGLFPALPSIPASDLSRVFFSVPRGATPGTSDGSVAAILDPLTNGNPTGWAVAGSSVRAQILVETNQRA